MASSKTAKERQAEKQKSLHLIKSLDPDDDNRTNISKKISWILRRGAKVAGVKQDDDGWVLVPDLLQAEILVDLSTDELMRTIIDSNGRKLRYELKDGPGGQQWIRCYSKEERKVKREGASGGTLKDTTTPSAADGHLRLDAQPFTPSKAPATPSSPQAAAGYAPSPTAGYWPGQAWQMMQMQQMAQLQMQRQMQQYWSAVSAAGSAASAAVSPGKHAGRIKSFNAEKGFGFIECTQTYSMYNRDVFLHKAHIGDLSVGSWVTFKCEVSKQGMPQATEVAAYGAAPPGGMGAGSGAGFAKGKGEKGGKGAKGEKGEKGGGKGGKSGKGKGAKGEKDEKHDGEEQGEKPKRERRKRGEKKDKGEGEEGEQAEGEKAEGEKAEGEKAEKAEGEASEAKQGEEKPAEGATEEKSS